MINRVKNSNFIKEGKIFMKWNWIIFQSLAVFYLVFSAVSYIQGYEIKVLSKVISPVVEATQK